MDTIISEEAELPRERSFRGKDESGRGDVESLEPYDPYEHRVVAKPNSDFGSFAHVLKTSLGSGILAMAMAFKNAGLVLGAFGTVFIGIVAAHCEQMLVNCSYNLCKRVRVPKLTFAETAQVAFETGPRRIRKFSKFAGIAITTELFLTFILGNTVYVVIMSDSIMQVTDFYFNLQIDIRFYMLMLWMPLILMCLLRNLKSLVPFSIMANCFVLISFAIILYYIFRDIRKPDSVNLVSPPSKWPLFLTTVIFALEGIGTILPIEHEMKNPRHFIGGRCGILYIAMTVVVSIYGCFGFFGYLQYGEDTRGSITLNLPVKDWMAQMVKLLIALALFFTYALQMYVPINILWAIIKDKVPEKWHLLCNTAIRAGMVSATIIMSVIVPNLVPVISLVGAIGFSTLGLLLPAVIDLVTRWPMFGRWRWRFFKNIFIMFISVVALLSGTYTSMIEIIASYT